jgi:thiol-disulfide isomerase/thioredoxin
MSSLYPKNFATTLNNPLCFVLVCCLFNHSIQAQKRFQTTIQFPKNVDLKGVKMMYENGRKEFIPLELNFNNHSVVVSGEFHSRYAMLRIHCPQKVKSSYYVDFWVWDEPSKIIFKDTVAILRSPTLQKALEVRIQGQEKLDAFMAATVKDFDDFYFANEQKIAANDSLTNTILTKKGAALDQKRFDFIKANKDLYYSFNLFRINSIYSDIPVDTLLQTYQSIFPEKLRKSEEGQGILNFLLARKLKSGAPAPLFVLKDIEGKAIPLKSLKGKYVLLNFWASWCKPCVEKIPYLKNLRAQFPVSKLEIISISSDDNPVAFRRALQKYQMNWTQAARHHDIEKMYGVTNFPATYLIDDNGKLAYSSWETTTDADLQVLNKKISTLLK